MLILSLIFLFYELYIFNIYLLYLSISLKIATKLIYNLIDKERKFIDS